jgi:hypothetical protein
MDGQLICIYTPSFRPQWRIIQAESPESNFALVFRCQGQNRRNTFVTREVLVSLAYQLPRLALTCGSFVRSELGRQTRLAELIFGLRHGLKSNDTELIQFHSTLKVAEIIPTRSIGVGGQTSTIFQSIELVNRL